MTRVDIINVFITRGKKYLEIGVQHGDCFRNVNCDDKTGIDPDKNSAATIFKTSDDFFKDNKEKFDVIFIDGLHHADQVERDIINSLKCLNRNGTILMHDCLPTNEFIQLVPQTTQIEWTGDCWKAFVKLRTERSDLFMYVINTDWGVGIIQRGKQEKLIITEEINYQNFEKNKIEWMNIK